MRKRVSNGVVSRAHASRKGRRAHLEEDRQGLTRHFAAVNLAPPLRVILLLTLDRLQRLPPQTRRRRIDKVRRRRQSSTRQELDRLARLQRHAVFGNRRLNDLAAAGLDEEAGRAGRRRDDERVEGGRVGMEEVHGGAQDRQERVVDVRPALRECWMGQRGSEGSLPHRVKDVPSCRRRPRACTARPGQWMKAAARTRRRRAGTAGRSLPSARFTARADSKLARTHVVEQPRLA